MITNDCREVSSGLQNAVMSDVLVCVLYLKIKLFRLEAHLIELLLIILTEYRKA